jgi:glycosyltransferase involved in cell wall biosynthesis
VKTVVSVLGIEPTRVGGAEAYARELSRQLGEQGWKSVLCFLKQPPERVRAYLDLPNVSIEVIEDSWRAKWSALLSLRRILRKYRPEILHLHFTGFLGPYPWLAKLCGVKKVFFTDHSSHPEGHVIRRAPFWKRLIARVINSPLTRVITVSDYGYRSVVGRDLVPQRRIEMVYNSADLSRSRYSERRSSQFRDRYSIPEDRALVVQVSWLIPEKGVADLLTAARIVIAENRQVHFALVGDGVYREQYRRQAEELGIADHVTFTGQVEDPMADGVYSAADLVCQVSRWEEVFGYVIAEAMSCGKPIVATRVGGIPELVKDGETGFLVERGDAQGIADRILRLAVDEQSRRQMGAAGRKVALDRFDLVRNVEKVAALYGVENGDPRVRERIAAVL